MKALNFQWGIFRQREACGEVHVIPAHLNKDILEPHIVDVLCPCKPIPEPRAHTNEKLIIVHNKIER